MPRLSFEDDFKLDLAFVTDCYVFSAAWFTEYGVVSCYSLSDKVLDASAGGFFFYNSGNQDFTFKPRLFASCHSSHNHSCKGTLRVHCASGKDFSLINTKRQIPRRVVRNRTACSLIFLFSQNSI